MTDGRWTIYPERRFVSASELIRWANDIIADDSELGPPMDDADEAAEFLQDNGDVTFTDEPDHPQSCWGEGILPSGRDDASSDPDVRSARRIADELDELDQPYDSELY